MRWQEESQSEAYASFYSWAVTGTVCRYGSSGHTALWQMLGSHRHVHMLAVFFLHTYTQRHSHKHTTGTEWLTVSAWPATIRFLCCRWSSKRRRSVRQRSPASLPYSTPPDTVPALSSVSATVVLNRFRLRLMSSCSAAPLRFTHWSEVWWGCVTTVVWAAAFIWTEWGGKTGERGREEQLSFHFD